MAYISSNYKNNIKAPLETWVCSPSSNLEPFSEVPNEKKARAPYFCGQCVSFVKQVCPDLPSSQNWKKGSLVKGNLSISDGTIIATFNKKCKFEGHVAVYVNQNEDGIGVYDQWVTPPHPKAIGQRLLSWGAHGISNNGDLFYVVV